MSNYIKDFTYKSINEYEKSMWWKVNNIKTWTDFVFYNSSKFLHH